MRLAVLEKGGARDDLLCASRQDVARAFGGPHAAADPAGQGRSDAPYDRQVVSDVHGGVEVDHLHLRKTLESRHPGEDVVVAYRQLLALNELDDGAALQVDRGNQHALPVLTASSRASPRRRFAPETRERTPYRARHTP